MKLLQRLLSRGLLITGAIALAIGYHFRAELFPERFGGVASEAVQSEITPSSANAASGPGQTAGTQALAETAPSESAAHVTHLPTEQDSAAVSTSTVTQDDLSSTLQPTGEDASVTQTMTAPAEVVAALPSESETAEQQASQAQAADTRVTQTQSQAASLDAARIAYWSRDLSAAEQLYRAVAASDTNNADPLGELGNLYYSSGRWQQAADAYAGAIERLIATGQQRRAQHLLMVLDGLDATRAQTLRSTL